jgi:hypothetical protein
MLPFESFIYIHGIDGGEFSLFLDKSQMNHCQIEVEDGTELLPAN